MYYGQHGSKINRKEDYSAGRKDYPFEVFSNVFQRKNILRLGVALVIKTTIMPII